MKTKYIFLATMLIICISTFSYSNGFGQSNQDKNHHIPKYEKTNGDTLVHHAGYSALFSFYHLVSKWVGYTLRKENIDPKFSECDEDYKLDPKIGINLNKDSFKGTIKTKKYETGHIVPRRHLRYSDTVCKEANYFTILTPQHEDLNGSLWVRLDKFTVRLANSYDSVYITTGCIFNEDFGRTKRNIAIPDAYFKAILIQYENEFKAIGFIIPNKKPKKTCLCSYAVTIDSLENLTGLDFFSQLDLTIQNKIESEIDSKLWGLCNDKCKNKPKKNEKSKKKKQSKLN